MNVLFLTLLDFSTIEENGIYTDLMREFVKDNHQVYIISPTEKRENKPTRLIDHGHYKILKLKIGSIQKTNILEKGISTLTIESKYKAAIDEYFYDVKFDLVLYSTPPITLQKAVEFVKRRDHAKTYLLLKDIFPQNAIDLGMLQKSGMKGLLYRYFRSKEEKLYKLSDYIGCMSNANVEYILKHNSGINPEVVEICPNSIDPQKVEKNSNRANNLKEKYGILHDKVTFIYGGNLGKAQGIDFLIECLKANENNEHSFFLIVGSGTEFNKLKNYFDTEKPQNAKLLNVLSKNDYEILANSCDVGLIFLDNRFTIPNFPSRLLSYMQAALPVLAATDVHTDIGEVIEKGQFGFWCKSGDVEAFNKCVNELCDSQVRDKLGNNARKFLDDHYTARHSYEIIMKHFK